MEKITRAKKLIEEANNIGILPSREETIPLSLALLYSLKKSNKNANLLIEEIPDKFRFLVPSMNFISPPKNFVLSIKKPEKTKISKVFYENNKDQIDFYIKTEKGSLKKDCISFKVSPQKNDLLISLGEYKKKKSSSQPLVLNIDNKKKSNSPKSLSEVVIDFLKSLEIEIGKDTATCLLTGLVLSTNNFQKSNTPPSAFKLAADLKEKGAPHNKIINHLFKT